MLKVPMDIALQNLQASFDRYESPVAKRNPFTDAMTALLQPPPDHAAAWFDLVRRQYPGAHNLSVYFIQCNGEKGHIKIGIARDVRQRIGHLRGANPYQLVLLAAEAAPRQAEGMLHERFKEARTRGEWFRPSDKLLKFVAELRGSR